MAVISIFLTYIIGCCISILVARKANKVLERKSSYYTRTCDAPIIFCMSWIGVVVLSLVYIFTNLKNLTNHKNFKEWLEQ